MYYKKKYLDVKSRIFDICSVSKRCNYDILEKYQGDNQKIIFIYYKKQLSGTQHNLALKSEYL